MFWIVTQVVVAYGTLLIGGLFTDEKALGDVFRFFSWLRSR